MNPVHEPSVDDIEVIHMTAVEWDQALTRSLNDVGLTWEQLTEQAKTGDFMSLKARQLWLMAGGQGPNQAGAELAKWKAKAEHAEGAAVNNRERADQFRQERDEARRELALMNKAAKTVADNDWYGRIARSEAALRQLCAYARWCNHHSVEPEARDILELADGKHRDDYIALMAAIEDARQAAT